MKNKATRLYVFPEFRTRLKAEAYKRDISVLKFTEMICKEDFKIFEKVGKKYEKEFKFTF